MCALRKLPQGMVWVNNHLPVASQHRKASVLLFRRISQYAHNLLTWRPLVLQLIQDVLEYAEMAAVTRM
jgi:hypothetical protein